MPGIAGVFAWFAGLNREDSWVTLLTRDVLEKNVSYKEAVDILSIKKLLGPVYYIIAGPKSRDVKYIFKIILK